ncbi:hypothetical protein OF83DRAFT_318152 [Amylostereum chailletii]|nr:hypothetical protein OF83DRAFT_318152 [Amylostereum chailletii]
MARSLSTTASRYPIWADDPFFYDDSDEQVVYLSRTADLASIPGSPRSDDFVLVPRAGPSSASPLLSFSNSRSPHAHDVQAVSDALASLSLTRTPASPSATPKAKRRPTAKPAPAAPVRAPAIPHSPESPKQRRRPRKPKTPPRSQEPSEAYPSPPASPSPSAPASLPLSSPTKPKSKKRTPKRPSSPRAAAQTQAERGRDQAEDNENEKEKEKDELVGLGARSVVDDVSEVDVPVNVPGPAYTAASNYIASYLANPPPTGNNGSLLLLLQALIIELGLHTLPASSPSTEPSSYMALSVPQIGLPHSLKQAKALLKTHAFINIRDYLAVRERGQAALQQAMHPSRRSLVREIRGGKRVRLGWVKKSGLNVLLVDTKA